jgi:hypothetical protein
LPFVVTTPEERSSMSTTDEFDSDVLSEAPARIATPSMSVLQQARERSKKEAFQFRLDRPQEIPAWVYAAAVGILIVLVLLIVLVFKVLTGPHSGESPQPIGPRGRDTSRIETDEGQRIARTPHRYTRT